MENEGLNITKEEFLSKLNGTLIENYVFNDDLYESFGDIELTDKDNGYSIYLYHNPETNKINVSVGASETREFVDTLDEAIEFINKNLLASRILQFYNEYNPYDEYGDKYCNSIEEILNILNDEKAKEELRYNLKEAQKDLKEEDNQGLVHEIDVILNVL